jgi:hypothetical protein
MPVTTNASYYYDPTTGGQIDPATGQLKYPGYLQGFNSDMETAPEFQKALNMLNMNNSALNKYRNEALRSGPSNYANLANKQNRMLAMEQRGNLADQIAGSNATAMSNLATHGGITSGAKERLAETGRNNLLDMSQNINNQASKNAMQIGANDEQNRISQLSQVPGMELGASTFDLDKEKLGLGAKQYDIGQKVGESARQNMFNMNKYNQGMSAWAANQQANATADSGKK